MHAPLMTFLLLLLLLVQTFYTRFFCMDIPSLSTPFSYLNIYFLGFSFC